MFPLVSFHVHKYSGKGKVPEGSSNGQAHTGDSVAATSGAISLALNN